ncbi:MAG: purine-nucleoside phosphorylase [Oscillospiraceae bacterium]
MGLVIRAKQGEVAESVLLPGDPLRAKFVAENFLTDVICYNEERNMLGYTGTYKGKRVSVQGTGMGIPSMTMCAHELICDFGVKNLIRIGTCGAIRKDVEMLSVIIAQSASSTSNVKYLTSIGNESFAPTATYDLVEKAADIAKAEGIKYQVGSILTTELFNNPDGFFEKWADWGHMAVEMETAGLYIEAAKYGANALSVLTVSDHLVTHELTTPEERQNSFVDMMKIALETAING